MRILVFYFLVLSQVFAGQNGELKILFLDTSVCPVALKNVHIVGTLANKRDCSSKKFLRKIHGHYVLKEFLHNLNVNIPITIFSVNVFTENGVPSLENWKKGLELARRENVHLIMSASGFQVKDKVDLIFPEKIPGIFASGSFGGGVGESDKFWPMSFSLPQVILVGSYVEMKTTKEKVYDTQLLNRDRIEFFADGETKEIGGTSRALGIFAAKGVSFCYKELLSRSGISDLKICLKNKLP